MNIEIHCEDSNEPAAEDLLAFGYNMLDSIINPFFLIGNDIPQ